MGTSNGPIIIRSLVIIQETLQEITENYDVTRNMGVLLCWKRDERFQGRILSIFICFECHLSRDTRTNS